MSRTQTRARRRRARIEAVRTRIRAEIETLRNQIVQAPNPDARVAATDQLVKLLKSIADSNDLPLWALLPEEFFGDDDAKALIAQLVAPHLAGQSPRWVRQRT